MSKAKVTAPTGTRRRKPAAVGSSKPAAVRKPRATVSRKKSGLLTHQANLEAAMWFSEFTNRVPCLWGPTASSKTYSLRRLAEEHGAKLIVVLLSQSTPDEVMGFQTIDTSTGGLVAQPPWWWKEAKDYLEADEKNRIFLLFDEIGQARQEVRAVMYTFLRDRTLHGLHFPGDSPPQGKLHTHTRESVKSNGSVSVEEEVFECTLDHDKPYVHNRVTVFAATNPATFSAAWRSRMAFVHWPSSVEHLTSIAKGHDIAEYAVKHGAKFVASEIKTRDPELSNEAPPMPETLDTSSVDCLRQINISFFRLPEEAQNIVLGALVPSVLAESIYRHIHESAKLVNADALLDSPDLLRKILEKLEKPKAVEVALNVLVAISQCKDEDKACEGMMAILDVFMQDAEKLLAYYDAQKPEQVIQDLAKNLNAQKLADKIVQGGRLDMKNDKLIGVWVEALVRQAEPEKQS